MNDMLTKISTFKHLFTFSIDNFTLLIHYVIIFKDMLTHIKVAAFHLFLGIFNGFGNHLMLNRVILPHAQFIHYRGNIFGTKQPQQIILQ